MKLRKITLLSLMLVAFSPVVFCQLTILSGPKQATQYQYVQDIATIVAPTLDFKIVNMETKGSSNNAELLMDPVSPYKLAIIQSDFMYYLQTQDMRFNTDKSKSLKVLAPLGQEQIHLVTKASKGYKGLKDMEKKVVAIGSAEQGTYRTAMLIMDRSKVNWSARNTHFDDCFKALYNGDIDAFFIVSSAPVEKLNINPQSMVDKLALVPLVDFNDWAKYYKPDIITKAEYKWLDHDVPTFSVPAWLVVNESKLSVEERDTVLKLKTALQTKLEELKTNGHAQWKQVDLTNWKESDWPSFK